MPWGCFYLTYSTSFDVYCNLLSLPDLYCVKLSGNLQLLDFCMGALKVIDSKPPKIRGTFLRSKLISLVSSLLSLSDFLICF
jgi:hypothetical protein